MPSPALYIQGSVIGLVDSLRDVCRTDTVTYFTNEGRTSAKGIYIGTVGTLAKGTDNGLARNKNLMAILILTDHAIGSNLLTNISGMGR